MEAQGLFPKAPSGLYYERRGRLHLLLHPNAPRWMVLNATGRAVVELCDGQHSIDQITCLFAQRWGLEENIARRDVENCLDSLRRAGFLTPPPEFGHSIYPFAANGTRRRKLG